MTLHELNPHHAVTDTMREQWAKVVALLMYRDGDFETVIPADVVHRACADPRGLNIAIQIDDERGITLRLVGHAEAERLADREGGR